MRFPKLSELDKDQTSIYQGAPPEGTVLIFGPPGTGKSVIAFHRAHYLSKLGRCPRVMMYNKVLARYTSKRGNIAKDVEVSTLHQWIWGWWRRVNGRFARVPALDQEGWVHDWDRIQAAAITAASAAAGLTKVNWGHLVIDEGQDFPPAMYASLKFIMEVANAGGAEPKLGVTVLADENQRLTARNSSIEQIRTSLGLHASDRNVFCLKKNYRNSREIAVFAGTFYVGLASGKPALPTRTGDKPVVTKISRDTHDKFLTACAEKIARYANLRRTDEVGVLVMGNREREKLVNRLKGRLEGSGVKLQSYASKDAQWPAEALEFDVPGHVTVLNYSSAKGLEFDAVFVVDPGKLMSAGSPELNVKMTMYVMCSRARSMLNIMLLDDDKSMSLLSFIPHGTYEMEAL